MGLKKKTWSLVGVTCLLLWDNKVHPSGRSQNGKPQNPHMCSHLVLSPVFQPLAKSLCQVRQCGMAEWIKPIHDVILLFLSSCWEALLFSPRSPTNRLFECTCELVEQKQVLRVPSLICAADAIMMLSKRFTLLCFIVSASAGSELSEWQAEITGEWKPSVIGGENNACALLSQSLMKNVLAI